MPASQASQELSSALARNSYSVVVMAPEDFIDFAIVQQKKSGLTDDAISAWLDRLISQSSSFSITAKSQWQRHKSNVKNTGSYLPVFSDAKALSALALEMKRGGHILSKYRVATYSGRSYVILEGYAGLRSQLQGTRYLANSPKVVSLGIGRLGAANAVKGGFVISVIFSVGFHALDQLMNDQATWHDFAAGVVVDLASAGAGTAIAWTAVGIFAGGTAMVAIGPIAVVVVAGAFLTVGFNALTDHLDLANKLADMLKEAEKRMLQNSAELKREVRRGLSLADEDPVGFMHRLFGVPYFGQTR